MNSYTTQAKWTTCNLQYKELQEEFTRNIEALGSISLPTDDLKRLLGSVLLAELRIILASAPPGPKSVNSSQDTPATGNHDATSDKGHAVKESPFESHYPTSTPQTANNSAGSSEIEAARSRIVGLLEALQPIGLGGGAFQRVFAEVMHEVMNEYIVNTFRHEWQAPSTVIPRLHDWIENRFARIVVEVLRRAATRRPLDGALETRTAASGFRDFVTLEDVQKWQEMSVGQLGRLRVSQFFDIVVEWDASMGAVQDLAVALPFVWVPPAAG
jgi:anaphase-promoting complex subunit 2